MSYINFQRTATVSDEQVSEALSAAMRRVYLWMCAGLVVTAIMAVVTASTPLITLLARVPVLFFGLLIVELGLVIGLSAALHKLSPAVALSLFFVYAILNGITLSFIFLAYTMASIGVAFFSTACMFGAMSLVGYTTKMDLSRFGSFLLMALIGIVLASVVNIFLASSALDWIITYVGLLIFLALTIYHTQRIKNLLTITLAQGDQQAVARVSLIGALSLYLDFINIFLRILRIIGRQR